MTDPLRDELAQAEGATAKPAAPPQPVVAADEPPPRPTWANKAPESPWCPSEWLSHIETLAPGWKAPAWALAAANGPSENGAPDAVGEQAAFGAWAVVAASRRGRLHAHRGEYREDAVAARTLPDGWCGAVADGAGSASWSRLGADIATHTFCGAFAETRGTPSERATMAARAVYATLRAVAEKLEILPRTLRTTMLAVAMVNDELLTLQVGDGGIVLYGADGRVTAPQAGHSGEFSGDVTLFLPDEGSGERLAASLHVAKASTVHAVLVASDGIEDPWYPLPKHAPAIRESLERGVSDALAATIESATSVQSTWRGPVVTAPSPIDALAGWMAFEKRGENDDRSLLYARVVHASGVGTS